jgi:hypothetical protein
LLSLPTTLPAPFSSILSPVFTSLSYPSSTCHHTVPPSYKLTTQGQVYCTNCTHPTHYNPWHKHLPIKHQKYTLKHTRAKNTAAPISLLTSTPHYPLFTTFCDTSTNYPSFYF